MRSWGPRQSGWQHRKSILSMHSTLACRARRGQADESRFQTDSSSAAVDDDPKHKLQRTEAVLVLSRGPLTTRKLAALAGLADATEARTLIRQLNQLYDQQGRAFRAEEVAGGYQLLTRPQFAPYLRRLGHVPQVVRLSSPMLETLAIVAYRQPVLRADIEAVRGVQSGELLRQLMERDLVRISGRSEELGRPYLYSTTKNFLQVFGLRNTDALPCSEWFKPASESEPMTAMVDDNLENPAPVLDSPDKESDVSIAFASPNIDAVQNSTAAIAVIPSDEPRTQQSPVNVIEDEEEDDWDASDDEDENWDDEDEDEDWDDDEDEDEADSDDEDWEEEDEDEADEKDGDWEEVDDDDDDDDDDELDDEEDDDLDDDETDEWVDDEDDDDWEDDDEEVF